MTLARSKRIPPTAKSKRAPSTARRKSSQHDLFPSTRSFDAKKIKKIALGLWRVSADPRGSATVDNWCKASGVTLPAEICGSVLRFHPKLTYGTSKAPGLVFLLRDIRTDEPVSVLRIFLDAETGKEIGRRPIGRTYDACIKLDADADVLEGLAICADINIALKAMNGGLRPVWVVSANALANFGLDGCEVTIINETPPRAVEPRGGAP
jgi:hypothetical protein